MSTPTPDVEITDDDAEKMFADAINQENGTNEPETEVLQEGTQLTDVDALQKQLDKARKDAAKARKNSDQAAEDAKNELVQQLGKMLGFVQPDEQDQPLDMQAVVAQLGAEREAAQEANLQLAVYRAASQTGADGDALLDSISFRNTLSGIDPSDGEAIAAAIKAAVEAKPTPKPGQEPVTPARYNRAQVARPSSDPQSEKAALAAEFFERNR